MTRRTAQRVLPGFVQRRLIFSELYYPALLGTGDPLYAVVYGNCQAEPLRRLLGSHNDFEYRYRTVRVPPVQEMNAQQVHLLHRLMPKVGLFIAQHVRRDYRGMALGTDQLIELLPPHAEVIRFPVAYFTGLYPFQVYVNIGDDALSVPAPITDYHDLRILWGASRGWDAQETARRVRGMKLDPDWVASRAEASLAELERREDMLGRPSAELSSAIRSWPAIVRSFHTINHPSNLALRHVANQVAQHLGIDPGGILTPERELLGHLVAPREAAVATALGEDPDSCWEHWRTPSGTFIFEQVAAAHLNMYAQHRDVLTAGLIKHDARLHELRGMWPA